MLTVDVREEHEKKFVRRIISVSEDARPSCPDTFFECHGIDLPKCGSLDFSALVTVFYAMRRGKALHINGAVSQAMLRDLEDFQDAWALWRPKYKVIHITPQPEVDDQERQERTGVFAYSGGVDGAFALIKH